MSRIIHLLNDLSFEAGIIGLIELEERNQIATWLFSPGNFGSAEIDDPRGVLDDEYYENEKIEEADVFRPIEKDRRVLVSSANDTFAQEPPVMQFLVLKRWYFTLGDADCAPSIPHGHENAKTQKWPKLNPYTGRVFTATHQEDAPRRLSRLEMQMLWRDDAFVDHCGEQVSWYADRYPHHRFANARRGLYAFPRW